MPISPEDLSRNAANRCTCDALISGLCLHCRGLVSDARTMLRVVPGPIVAEMGYVTGRADEGRSSLGQFIKRLIFKNKELPMKRMIQVKFSALEAQGCVVDYVGHNAQQGRRVFWPDNVKRYGLPVCSVSEHKDFFRITLDSNEITPIEAFLRDQRVPRIIEFMGQMPEHLDTMKPAPSLQKSIEQTAAITRVITADLMALAEAGFNVKHDGVMKAKVALFNTGVGVVSEEVNCLKLTTQMIDTPHGQLSTEREQQRELLSQMRKAGVDHTITRHVVYPKPGLNVTAIQVAATYQNADQVEVVPEADEGKTHYSVYLRLEDGTVKHADDTAIAEEGRGGARLCAMSLAAALSMEHQVPIEPIH